MSEVRVDTITASNGTGPVTLTKQEAVKHYVNYDAINQTTDSSLNQSSFSDYETGQFGSSFTNNFNSGTDKIHHASAINSATDGTSRIEGVGRAGVLANIGHCVNNDDLVSITSTSIITFYSATGSSSGSNGEARDCSATYLSSIGDLA